MSTAREDVLDHGLIDWVDLGRVHSAVMDESPNARIEELQEKTLSLIRSLVGDGLCEIGDLSGKGGNFLKWDLSLDEAMQRIYDMYVTRHSDEDFWLWGCWLRLTRNGVRVARGVEGVGTAREDVLLTGLCGWVDLGRIHRYVEQDIPDAPLAEVQNATLSLVRSLVSDGLFEIGDFASKTRSFTTWDRGFDPSMQRIYQLYVVHFDDTLRWSREIRLKLTEKGLTVAQAVEGKRELSLE